MIPESQTPNPESGSSDVPPVLVTAPRVGSGVRLLPDCWRETAGRWPDSVVEMLLAAWGATIGRPAFVTTTVADIVGSPARPFRQWVVDHADAFRTAPESRIPNPESRERQFPRD